METIKNAQTSEQFHLWFASDDMRVYFPNNEITADSTFDKMMTDLSIEKFVAEDDETFLDFVYKEFQYSEILLSSDGMMELYKKHIENLSTLHNIAKVQYSASREASKTKKRLVERTTIRVREDIAGTLNLSRPNVAETTNVQYLKDCKVLQFLYFYSLIVYSICFYRIVLTQQKRN